MIRNLISKETVNPSDVRIADRIRKGIDSDRPVIAIMRSYSIANSSALSSKEGTDHDVIMYGYRGEDFLCHFGWDPGFTSYSEIIVHHPNNHGYFHVRYNGGHVRSKAAFDISTGRWVCGCGAVL